MNTPNVFQLSVLSQNDPSTLDGSSLACVVFNVSGGSLSAGSSPILQPVSLPVPPPPGGVGPPTPTWFLQPAGNILNTSFGLLIFCPTDFNYQPTTITVQASDVAQWANIPTPRPNQIYAAGPNGIFGYAQNGPDGLIYTVTAGVYYPQVYPNN